MTVTYIDSAVEAEWIRGDDGEWGKTYPAKVADVRWNGWAVPKFDRATAEQYVIDHNANATDDDPHLIWDGDALVIKWHPDFGYADERVEADPDGDYSIGAFDWCWRVAP